MCLCFAGGEQQIDFSVDIWFMLVIFFDGCCVKEYEEIIDKYKDEISLIKYDLEKNKSLIEQYQNYDQDFRLIVENC